MRSYPGIGKYILWVTRRCGVRMWTGSIRQVCGIEGKSAGRDIYNWEGALWREEFGKVFQWKLPGIGNGDHICI